MTVGKSLLEILSCSSCGEQYNLDITARHDGTKALMLLKCNECNNTDENVAV